MSLPAKLRIAVNLRQYYRGKIGGMENYVRNVLGALDRVLRTAAAQP